MTLRLTDFLPGQGSAEAVTAARGRASSAGRGLRRDRSQAGGLRPRRHPRDAWRAAVYERAWSAEQRLYCRVFRPAVQHIRRTHLDQPALGEGRCPGPRHEYARLKHVLPRMSELGFTDWQALRARAEGGRHP